MPFVAMTRVVSCVVLSLAAVALPAQAQVVHDSNGTTEFIGLSSWSPKRLIDTLRILAPGQPVHQCAAVLKNQVGFPEASVTYYSQNRVTVVTVLERRDSALVRYYVRPAESLSIPSNWQPLIAVADSEPRQLFLALLTWRYVAMRPDSAATMLAQFGSTPDTIGRIWVTIRAAGSKEIALQLLQRDSSSVRRRAALASLIRFPSDPAVWRAVVRALRDPDEGVGVTAARVLEEFTNYSARPVDWRPETESVRAILDGTRLFFFTTLVRALNATHVDPVLAPQLLGNGGRLLLAYATSTVAPDRTEVRALLSRLTGTDAGPDGKEWRDWIASNSRH